MSSQYFFWKSFRGVTYFILQCLQNTNGMQCVLWKSNPNLLLVPYIRAISTFIRWNTIKVKNVIFADSNDYSLCMLGQAIFSRIVSHLVWRSLALDTWPQFSTCSCNSPYVKLLNKQFYWTKKGTSAKWTTQKWVQDAINLSVRHIFSWLWSDRKLMNP